MAKTPNISCRESKVPSKDSDGNGLANSPELEEEAEQESVF
jgi:hypothetical protein